MKVNWPFLAVITSFLYFVTGVWADMPEPFNVANGLAFVSFVAFCIYYRGIQKKKNEL
jgi:hypothetical protein